VFINKRDIQGHYIEEGQRKEEKGYLLLTLYTDASMGVWRARAPCYFPPQGRG
jgi:hypothetical protein